MIDGHGTFTDIRDLQTMNPIQNIFGSKQKPEELLDGFAYIGVQMFMSPR